MATEETRTPNEILEALRFALDMMEAAPEGTDMESFPVPVPLSCVAATTSGNYIKVTVEPAEASDFKMPADEPG